MTPNFSKKIERLGWSVISRLMMLNPNCLLVLLLIVFHNVKDGKAIFNSGPRDSNKGKQDQAISLTLAQSTNWTNNHNNYHESESVYKCLLF